MKLPYFEIKIIMRLEKLLKSSNQIKMQYAAVLRTIEKANHQSPRPLRRSCFGFRFGFFNAIEINILSRVWKELKLVICNHGSVLRDSSEKKNDQNTQIQTHKTWMLFYLWEADSAILVQSRQNQPGIVVPYRRTGVFFL